MHNKAGTQHGLILVNLPRPPLRPKAKVSGRVKENLKDFYFFQVRDHQKVNQALTKVSLRVITKVITLMQHPKAANMLLLFWVANKIPVNSHLLMNLISNLGIGVGQMIPGFLVATGLLQ